MILHELERGDKFRLISTGAPPSHRVFCEHEILEFSHTDGSYSYCTDKDGRVVHPLAYSEVEKV